MCGGEGTGGGGEGKGRGTKNTWSLFQFFKYSITMAWIMQVKGSLLSTDFHPQLYLQNSPSVKEFASDLRQMNVNKRIMHYGT